MEPRPLIFILSVVSGLNSSVNGPFWYFAARDLFLLTCLSWCCPLASRNCGHLTTLVTWGRHWCCLFRKKTPSETSGRSSTMPSTTAFRRQWTGLHTMSKEITLKKYCPKIAKRRLLHFLRPCEILFGVDQGDRGLKDCDIKAHWPTGLQQSSRKCGKIHGDRLLLGLEYSSLIGWA